MPDLVTGLFSNFQIGLLSFPLLIALIFLRIPLAASMFIVGLLGTWLLAGDMRMMNNQLKTFAFGTLTNYSFSIIPLFLLMSEFATARACRGAVQGGGSVAGAPAWRGRHGGNRRVCRLWRGLRLIAGNRSSMGKAARRSCSGGYWGAGHGYAGRWRDAWDPDPAVGGAGDLCHPRRGKHRQAVHRRLYPRRAGHARLHDHHRRLCPAQPRRRAHPATPAVYRALPRAGPGVAGDADFCAGDRRHLHRAVLTHGGGGGRGRGTAILAS